MKCSKGSITQHKTNRYNKSLINLNFQATCFPLPCSSMREVKNKVLSEMFACSGELVTVSYNFLAVFCCMLSLVILWSEITEPGSSITWLVLCYSQERFLGFRLCFEPRIQEPSLSFKINENSKAAPLSSLSDCMLLTSPWKGSLHWALFLQAQSEEVRSGVAMVFSEDSAQSKNR